jgi:opacity protein-like surface antigen
MKRLLLIVVLALGLLLLACGAWLVQGARWALTGSARRRDHLATA